jgi:ribosomal protein S18 acetylase RimI-like enzyme
MSGLLICALRPEHHEQVIGKVDEWWGGRPMMAMLPKLFFTHFRDTSFAAEDDERCVGFLAGFSSQTNPAEAYVHFIGVDPAYRQRNVGRMLYEQFWKAVERRGARVVLGVTSPMNRASLAFHRKLGFAVVPSSHQKDGVYVHENYDGPGEDRVLLRREL